MNQLNRVGSKTKTKIFSLIFVLIIALASVLVFSSASQTIASDITAEKILGLTNSSRAAAGESMLTANPKLSLAAEAKADDMIAKNYFSHTSPEGVTPWKWIDGESYDYSYAGENLAMDFQSADKMEDAWMKSPTHRANILNEKYKDIGVAVKAGSINGSETILAVVMFGSGDKKSAAIQEPQTNVSNAKEKDLAKNIFSMLPSADPKSVAMNFQEPVITSPQSGERLSSDEVKIAGRADPGSKINVFDNDDFLYSATADASGWFFLTKNFSGGEHNLRIRSDRVSKESQTNFFVDQKKPEIEYHLFADRNNPHQFFLETSANKNDCTFQFDGESRYVAEEKKVLFAIDSKKSSAILRVSDKAGNKDFKQINLANYYAPEKKDIFYDKLANLIFAPENVFVADSGREAMKKNLGIAPHQFFASRVAVGNN
ncbi:MAG: CAP domain-containing protein [Candidatus Moranbacteria bacterium]|nr:CAP domain-containing protein [Candidatus Moranbacteria bacterium]